MGDGSPPVGSRAIAPVGVWGQSPQKPETNAGDNANFQLWRGDMYPFPLSTPLTLFLWYIENIIKFVRILFKQSRRFLRLFGDFGKLARGFLSHEHFFARWVIDSVWKSLRVLQLVLLVQNLPAVSTPENAANSGYECIFTGHGTTLRTSVTRVNRIDSANTTLRCETPPSKHLPLFPAGKGTGTNTCPVNQSINQSVSK